MFKKNQKKVRARFHLTRGTGADMIYTADVNVE